MKYVVHLEKAIEVEAMSTEDAIEQANDYIVQAGTDLRVQYVDFPRAEMTSDDAPKCPACGQTEVYHDNYSIWRGTYVCGNLKCLKFGLPDDTTPEEAALYAAEHAKWEEQYKTASPEAKEAMGRLYEHTAGGLFGPEEALAIIRQGKNVGTGGDQQDTPNGPGNTQTH